MDVACRRVKEDSVADSLSQRQKQENRKAMTSCSGENSPKSGFLRSS